MRHELCQRRTQRDVPLDGNAGPVQTVRVEEGIETEVPQVVGGAGDGEEVGDVEVGEDFEEEFRGDMGE